MRLQVEEQFVCRQPLDDLPLGFRVNCSVAHLLAKAVNDWLLARDSGSTSAVVFIDLSKAFGHIRHQSLLLDLHAAGICMWLCPGLVCKLPVGAVSACCIVIWSITIHACYLWCPSRECP